VAVPGDEKVSEHSEDRFARFLRDHHVGLKEDVTCDQLSARAEELAQELVQATLAASGIYTPGEIARQFQVIVENAESIERVLADSPFVRDELQWVTPRRLIESWGRKALGNTAASGSERVRVRQEWQRIDGLFEAHPISRLVAALAEGAAIGARAAENDDTPQARRDTIRDHTIASRCADVFEELTQHQAARLGPDSGPWPGRFPAFVYVVCDRIHEIRWSRGLNGERPHPSDRTIKAVVKGRKT
jgi:hypothetical protein